MEHLMNALVAVLTFYGNLGYSSPSIHGSFEPQVPEKLQNRIQQSSEENQ